MERKENPVEYSKSSVDNKIRKWELVWATTINLVTQEEIDSKQAVDYQLWVCVSVL